MTHEVGGAALSQALQQLVLTLHSISLCFGIGLPNQHFGKLLHYVGFVSKSNSAPFDLTEVCEFDRLPVDLFYIFYSNVVQHVIWFFWV